MTSTKLHAASGDPRPADTCSPRFGSVKTWCQLSGMGATSTYAALQRGDLSAVKVGRRTLIDIERGLAWLRKAPAWQPRDGY